MSPKQKPTPLKPWTAFAKWAKALHFTLTGRPTTTVWKGPSWHVVLANGEGRTLQLYLPREESVTEAPPATELMQAVIEYIRPAHQGSKAALAETLGIDPKDPKLKSTYITRRRAWESVRALLGPLKFAEMWEAFVGPYAPS